MTDPGVSTDDLDAGARALDQCNWADARAAFERAIADGAGPKALEGLAQATFFLDEVELALETHERAYAGYREAGCPIDAARMAIALAWDYRSGRGERAVSDGWLARARRLLDGCGPTPELGWLALREASFSLPGDATHARMRCAEAEALGRELGDVDLEMTAVALDGLARVSQGDIAAGMARLDEATAAATAGDMQDLVAIGFSCCYLIFACERVRDFERAGQWCQRVADMSAGWNIAALRAVCRCHYATVLMLRGEWETAEVELTDAGALLAARPFEGIDAMARLAELRRRQGRHEEAAALLRRAEHNPTAVLSSGALALDRGDAAAAADGASRFLRLMAGTHTERAPGLELLAEAQAAAGAVGEAAAAAEELAAIASSAGTDPLRGAARFAEGCADAAGQDFEAAREAFEDAVGLLGNAGLPFEAARARVGLASALRELGRDDAARAEYDRAVAVFADLGAASEERRAKLLRRTRRAELSAREREVLGLVAQGRTNAEIASALVLSEHTVHRHVANVLAKLGCSKRAEAVAVALEEGLL
ncbi:MAG TPA: LuxR C-terminal-related transcriptional regulator [Thermoleophilaceae bacterium]|jgi:ATP/maltotriose-dependent transcriptional regulator MalT